MRDGDRSKPAPCCTFHLQTIFRALNINWLSRLDTALKLRRFSISKVREG